MAVEEKQHSVWFPAVKMYWDNGSGKYNYTIETLKLFVKGKNMITPEEFQELCGEVYSE